MYYSLIPYVRLKDNITIQGQKRFIVVYTERTATAEQIETR